MRSLVAGYGALRFSQNMPATMDATDHHPGLLPRLQTQSFSTMPDHLLQMTKKKIGKTPAHFTTYDLHAYKVPSKRIFGKNTNHFSGAALPSKRRNRLGKVTHARYHPSNNKMERLNGEFRDGEQTRRGLKKPDTAIIGG